MRKCRLNLPNVTKTNYTAIEIENVKGNFIFIISFRNTSGVLLHLNILSLAVLCLKYNFISKMFVAWGISLKDNSLTLTTILFEIRNSITISYSSVYNKNLNEQVSCSSNASVDIFLLYKRFLLSAKRSLFYKKFLISSPRIKLTLACDKNGLKCIFSFCFPIQLALMVF